MANVQTETIRLEALQFYATQAISRHELRGYLNDPQFSSYFPATMNALVLSLYDVIYGQKFAPVELVTPRDWWQAVRERWAPQWWLDKHPVRMRRLTVNAATLWPGVRPPNRGPFIDIITQQRLTVDGPKVESDPYSVGHYEDEYDSDFYN